MAKDKSIYVCTECGGTHAKWLGQCPQCQAWNTLVESVAESTSKPRYTAAARGLLPGEAVSTLSEIEATDADRQPTGIDELDRALGGGIVAGGVILIGGDPGIGKSTLLLQALDALSRNVKTLYVTGEESGAQVALRSGRATGWRNPTLRARWRPSPPADPMRSTRAPAPPRYPRRPRPAAEC